MKRIHTLYRVSTKKQVDKEKNDIPMQRLACKEFAEQQGWVITREFEEKGVSGFKVSANNRDAIQELKEAASMNLMFCLYSCLTGLEGLTMKLHSLWSGL